MKKTFILLISLSTACLGMSQEEQARAAWKAISNSGAEILRPHEQWWHEATVQPHRKQLETARQMYREMGIKPPFLRTSFLGKNAERVSALRSGRELASADEMGVHLGPGILHYLGWNNIPWAQSFAKQTLAHEDIHHENQDFQHQEDRISMGLPPEMFERWNFNSVRRDEFNADKRSYEKLPIEDLLRVRDVEAQFAEHHQEPHDDLHPSHRENLLMIDEELEARKTGKRLSEAESPAAQSFFSRSYHPDVPTKAEFYSIIDELKWLNNPENQSKKKERIKYLGGDLYELTGKRHNFWIYYGQTDGMNNLLSVAGNKTHEESVREARELLDYSAHSSKNA